MFFIRLSFSHFGSRKEDYGHEDIETNFSVFQKVFSFVFTIVSNKLDFKIEIDKRALLSSLFYLVGIYDSIDIIES